MNQTWLDQKLKTKENDIQMTPNLIYGKIRTPEIKNPISANSKLIWPNFTLFSFLRQKPMKVFLNFPFLFSFFYATDIFWTVIEWKNQIFFLFLFLDMLQNQEE